MEPEEFREVEEAKETRDHKALESGGALLSVEDFALILERSGLNVSQFAHELGVNRQMIYYIKSGQRPITKGLDCEIRKRFNQYL